MKQIQKCFLIVAFTAMWFQNALAQHSGSASQVVTFGIHYVHSLAFAGPAVASFLSNNQPASHSSLIVTIPASRPQKITAVLGPGASREVKISVKVSSTRKALSTIPTELIATATNVMSQRFDYDYLADTKVPPASSTNVIFTITD